MNDVDKTKTIQNIKKKIIEERTEQEIKPIFMVIRTNKNDPNQNDESGQSESRNEASSMAVAQPIFRRRGRNKKDDDAYFKDSKQKIKDKETKINSMPEQSDKKAQ